MRNSPIDSIPELDLQNQGLYHEKDLNLQWAINHLKSMSTFRKMGVEKKRGVCLEDLFLTILMFPLVTVSSLSCFVADSLAPLLKGGKDVLYDFMGKQTINWGAYTLKTAMAFYKKSGWEKSKETKTAFVVDDTLKTRRGKKVEAVSSHYDHNTGRHVMGQQVLQFGLVRPEGFLPLLAQIFIGCKKRIELSQSFSDLRCALAKSYKNASDSTKHEMLAEMVRRAISFGFSANYLIGDAWFGCKANISLALQNDLTAIFMMKRNKTKYHYKGKEYTAKGLYRKFRKEMKKLKDKSYLAFSTTVEYNLAETSNEIENWIKVQLVFSKSPKSPKNSWVLLLCSDIDLELEELIDVYALRWDIEVYFKEVKQNLGFLKEQSWRYSVSYLSVHMAMIRYILFFYLSLHTISGKLAEIRHQVGHFSRIAAYGNVFWAALGPQIMEILALFKGVVLPEILERLHKEIEFCASCYLRSLISTRLGLSPTEIDKLDHAAKIGAL